MALIELPVALSKAYWDKKKGAIPAGSALESELKAFDKKLQPVDWRSFEPGWEKKAADSKALEAAWTTLEKSYRAKVLPLKGDAQSLADAAQKLLKDKALAKPSQDAAKAIVDEVKAFAKSVDAAFAAMGKLHDEAARALEKSAASESAEEEEDEGVAELLDPVLLRRSLEICRKTPGRRLHFGFVPEGKLPPALALSLRTPGRRLFAKLNEATQVRIGGFGDAWIDEGVLYLMMEKPFGGIVKKIRLPLKAAQFKVRRVVLVEEGGQVLEQDEETEEGVEHEAGVAPEKTASAYGEGLLRLMPLVERAKAGNWPAAGKIQPLLDFAQGKAQAGNEAAAVQALQALEKLLVPPPSTGPAAARSEVLADLWRTAKEQVDERISSLRSALLAHGDPELSRIADEGITASGLAFLTGGRLVELTAALTELRGKPGGDAALNARASRAAAQMRTFLASDSAVALCDDNPLTGSLGIRSSLIPALEQIESQTQGRQA